MTPIIDERGRLFGRVNLVDAAIGAFVVVLLPMAYATFLLFRPSKPVITSVDRAQITFIEERAGAGTKIEGKLKVHGTGLRPTLRAAIGNTDAVGFLFETPLSADVLFGEIPAGTYDLVLFDGVQEVARARNAVTIPRKTELASTRVLAVGALVELDEAAASALRPAGAAETQGEAPAIVALGPVEPDYRRVSFGAGLIDLPVRGRLQRQAAVVMSCELTGSQECRVGGASLGLVDRTVVITAQPGPVRLLIHELVPATPPVAATARVRFAAYPEIVDRARVGDRDLPRLALDGRAATIESIARRPDVAGQLTFGSTGTDRTGERGNVEVGQASIPDRLAIVDTVLRLGLDRSLGGWRYRGQPVKLGGTIMFSTDAYTMRGSILSLTPMAPAGATPTP